MVELNLFPNTKQREYITIEIIDKKIVRMGMNYGKKDKIEIFINGKKAINKSKHKCEKCIVRVSDSAVCKICNNYFGWWCEESPTKHCKYTESEDDCDYCHNPEERK